MGAKRNISSWWPAVTMEVATAVVVTTVTALQVVGAEVTEEVVVVMVEVEVEDMEEVTVMAHPVGAGGEVVAEAEEDGIEDLREVSITQRTPTSLHIEVTGPSDVSCQFFSSRFHASHKYFIQLAHLRQVFVYNFKVNCPVALIL